jgi:hypothetical protein
MRNFTQFLEKRQLETLAFEMTKNNVDPLDLAKVYDKEFAPGLMNLVEAEAMPQAMPQPEGKILNMKGDEVNQNAVAAANEFEKRYAVLLKQMEALLEIIHRFQSFQTSSRGSTVGATNQPGPMDSVYDKFMKIYVFLRDQNIAKLKDLMSQAGSSVRANQNRRVMKNFSDPSKYQPLPAAQARMAQQQQAAAKKKK